MYICALKQASVCAPAVIEVPDDPTSFGDRLVCEPREPPEAARKQWLFLQTHYATGPHIGVPVVNTGVCKCLHFGNSNLGRLPCGSPKSRVKIADGNSQNVPSGFGSNM